MFDPTECLVGGACGLGKVKEGVINLLYRYLFQSKFKVEYIFDRHTSSLINSCQNWKAQSTSTD